MTYDKQLAGLQSKEKLPRCRSARKVHEIEKIYRDGEMFFLLRAPCFLLTEP
ncbi:hypothetical protein [Methanosarcina horonobensis]|uniref:hypothetical protein n=1 Tax=Methanosarcina horonobensis TaxID=418008 RepID=UPI00138E4624|nr:hypothetical protein [Methanosarcina horonobensis]